LATKRKIFVSKDQERIASVCFADKNECSDPLNSLCDANAECINTVGGYECRCNSGYVNVGGVCEGTYGRVVAELHFSTNLRGLLLK